MATAALKKKSDNTLKLEMFTKLKNEIETFKNELTKNFKTSESELKATVTSTVSALTADMHTASVAVNDAVTRLHDETRALLQTECVMYVNTSVSDVRKQTDDAVSSLRNVLQTSVDTVLESLREITEVYVPKSLAESSAHLATLDDRVTSSNDKMDNLLLEVRENISAVLEWSEQATGALRVAVQQQMDESNATTSAYIVAAVEEVQQKLLTLAVNTDDELSVLQASDAEVRVLIEELRADVYSNITTETVNAAQVRTMDNDFEITVKSNNSIQSGDRKRPSIAQTAG